MKRINPYIILFTVIMVGACITYCKGTPTYYYSGGQKYREGYEYGLPIIFIEIEYAVNLAEWPKEELLLRDLSDQNGTTFKEGIFCRSFSIYRFLFCLVWWLILAHVVAAMIHFKAGRVQIRYSITTLFLLQTVVALYLFATLKM